MFIIRLKKNLINRQTIIIPRKKFFQSIFYIFQLEKNGRV